MGNNRIIGIGSALLDFTFEINDSSLNELGLKKGKCTFIDKETSNQILSRLKDFQVKISSGGSSSNVMAGISYLGGNSSFIGKIGNDSSGKIYEEKTKEDGVTGFFSKHENEITGHAITFITPDFERTFAVNMGASSYLKNEDIPYPLIKGSKILHLEGYQLGNPELRKVVYYATKIAKENNTLVSLDLSDSGLIKNNLSIFNEFIKENVNIVFANESEAEVFTGHLGEEALLEISKISDIAIVKLGENGSLIRTKNKTYKILPYKTKVINTNGAGDMYAAGILYGILNNINLEKAGKIASYSASLVVGKQEARYGKELRDKINRFYFTKVL